MEGFLEFLIVFVAFPLGLSLVVLIFFGIPIFYLIARLISCLFGENALDNALDFLGRCFFCFFVILVVSCIACIGAMAITNSVPDILHSEMKRYLIIAGKISGCLYLFCILLGTLNWMRWKTF